MIKFTCFVLEDIMEPGMYMAPETPGVAGCLTFRTVKDADEYLWSKDCLIAMGYRVLMIGIEDPYEIQD